ncbi:hypothetical protein MMC10_010211 [Thelotrema lepadinum]|nr:hypothetical protein [Thelotrema lepadinum]
MSAIALTFGSVGDIIALCSLISNAVDAVSRSYGSSAQYQSLAKNVVNLSQALVSVQFLLDQEPNLQRRGNLEKIVVDCHASIVNFLQRIQVFECLGQQGNSRDSAKVLRQKLRWPIYRRECDAFRAEVLSHITSISVILATSGLLTQHYATQSILGQSHLENEDLKSQIAAGQAKVIERDGNFIDLVSNEARNQSNRHDEMRSLSLRTTDTSLNVIQSLNSNHLEYTRRFDELESTLTVQRNDANNLSSILGNLSQDGKRLLQSLLKVLQSVLRLGDMWFLIFANLVEQIVSYSSLPILTWSNSILYFEDALLRRFQIDLDFMPFHTSDFADETFVEALERRFVGSIGENLVRTRIYTFEDQQLRPLDLKSLWSERAPARRYGVMRAIIPVSGTLLPAARQADLNYKYLPFNGYLAAW